MSIGDLIFEKVIIPLSYYMKGDNRFSYYAEYKKNLLKSKDEIQRFQLDRLKALVKHAYDTVPYYKELFTGLKLMPEDIDSVDDLKKIPALEKKTVLENPDVLKSKSKYELIKTFSGGSTGNKVTIYKDKRYYSLCSAVWLRDLYSVGITPGMKSAWIWGNTVQDQPFKKKMAEWLSFKVNRRIIFNVFKYTDDDIESWIKNSFNKFKPDYIYGYAGILFDIAKCIKERDIKFHPIKKIITTSERLDHRQFIEEIFKCKIHDQYGCSEINSVAIEDDKGVMHTSDDFVLVEVNSHNEILLTPLESYGMPLLRYKVGDIGFVNRHNETYSASPFNEFNLTVGRVYEILFNRKKEKIGGGLIKQMIEDEDLEINEFQVVQHSFDLVDLNVVKDKFTKENAVNRTAEIIKEVLGSTEVKINYMTKYPVEKNGKRIAFKCMLPK